MSTPIRIASVLAVLAFLVGCNEGASIGGNDPDPHAPDVYAVSGSITYEGAPVSGEATFTPVAGGKAITTSINDGSYELKVPSGKYQVTLSGKAGDADLPDGLTVERAVRPDTTVQSITISLPETAPESREGSTPDEVRDLPISGSSEK